ncbi:hypothetical protein SUGI_0032650 [Cryptomeria japonica]|nr:hypothetical protein SUGI_0032650 [Cryptomeria japonica]
MDSGICLCLEKREMSFVGEISKKRWSVILRSEDDLVIHATKRILGNELMNTKHRKRANSDIPVGFAAILLTMGEDTTDTTSLCRLIFNNKYLVNLELAIKCVDDNLYIPYLEDYVRASGATDKGESLKIDFKRPILAIKDKKSFQQWQPDIKQWLGVVK